MPVPSSPGEHPSIYHAKFQASDHGEVRTVVVDIEAPTIVHAITRANVIAEVNNMTSPVSIRLELVTPAD